MERITNDEIAVRVADIVTADEVENVGLAYDTAKEVIHALRVAGRLRDVTENR